MKLLLLAALVLGVLALAPAASAGPWKPGTPTMVSEEDMNDLLEQGFDSAYCRGIPRFGHRGEFPYEEFVVFDCSIDYNDYSCFDRRYQAVKSAKRGYFRSKLLRPGRCY